MVKKAVPQTGSPAGSINREEMKKVGKGALIAFAGAALTVLVDVIPGVDFGKYTVVVMAVNSVVVNLLRIWLSNNK